jgi:large subunit ribosomal protein L25
MVLVKDVQYDLLKRTPVHVDFQQVRMDEMITVEVGLKLVGESMAVKSDGAVLVESLHSLKVECLPADLQHEIEVDISSLDKVGQVIHVSDLPLKSSWKLVGHEPEDVVLSVMEPKVEAEPVAAAEVVPAEGEAAPAAEGEAADKAEGKKESK